MAAMTTYELPIWPAPSNSNYDDLWSLDTFDPFFDLNDFTDIDLRRLFDSENVPVPGTGNPEHIPLHKIPTLEDGSFSNVPTLGQLEKILSSETFPLDRLPTPEPDPMNENVSSELGTMQSLINTPTSTPTGLFSQATSMTGLLLSRASTHETNPLDSIPTPEPSPLPNKPIPEALSSTPVPASNPMHNSSSPESSPLHRTPRGSSPLEMFEMKPEAIKEIGNSLESTKVVLNSEKGEMPMDCEDNGLHTNVKKEQEQEDSFDNESLLNNGIKTEKAEQLSNDAEESSNSNRPLRHCHSRYSFRSGRGSLHKQSRPTVRKTVVLWKFIKELLEKNDPCVSWISREEGTFKFVDSKQAAKLWGQRKNKRNMTYEKMSRALRYYYDRQIMYHDEGQKLMYRFGDGAREDRGQSESDES